MKTLKDLVTFLSKLKGDYPIPFIDRIVNEEDYSITWTKKLSYVDCSFFQKECDDYLVSINLVISEPEHFFSTTDNYAISDENYICKLEECLRELYATN